MGTAPPPDGPPPAQQQQIAADASFQAGPPVAQLCGFKLPSLQFSFGFTLPPINFPPKLPSLQAAIGLNCDTDNPLDISAGLDWGGGRVGTQDPDPDDLLDQATS